MGAGRRRFDPLGTIEERAAERLGWEPQRARDLANQDRDRTRDANPTRPLTGSALLFFRDGIGASGNATYNTRRGATTGMPIARRYRLDRASRLYGVRLWTASARTTGTATLQVEIEENGVVRTVVWGECQLNATNTTDVEVVRDPREGIPLADGAKVHPRIVTAGSYAPAADMGCELLVAYEAGA